MAIPSKEASSTKASLYLQILKIVCQSLLVSMVAIVILQVFFRYVLHNSLSWAEDLARYLMIWLVMIGGALVTRDNTHFKVDFLVNIFPPLFIFIVEAVIKICLLIFLVILIYTGWTTALFQMDEISPSLRTPMTWPYMAFPAGAVLMGVSAVLRIVEQAKAVRKGA
jgi:TRAP-type C4-dicarboxylate transport system permease small subunit